MRWLDGITDSMDEFEQTPGDSEGQESLVCCSPWGLDTTQQLNNNTIASPGGATWDPGNPKLDHVVSNSISDLENAGHS